VFTSAVPRNTEFTRAIKYKLPCEGFFEPRLPELPDPISCRDEIIPDPDSISLSVLNHSPGKRLEIDFAAYDPPEITFLSSEGAHPVSVLCLNSPLEILTVE
jgi:hypothetical protein